MYRVIYIKYVSAFDVTPVTGKREREIALSIGKINDEERTGLITGERVSKRKKKKKSNVHRYFAWKQGRKEGRKEGFFVGGISLPRLFIRSVITGDLIGSIERKRGISYY